MNKREHISISSMLSFSLNAKSNSKEKPISKKKEKNFARITEVNEFYEFLNATLEARFEKSHPLRMRHQVVQ